jgi:DNA-binding NtrC family response regulator
MIRTLFFSGNSHLGGILAASLGEDIEVRTEAEKTKVLALVARNNVDVVIVDLDDRFAPLEERLEAITELRAFELPIMVLSDDDSRSTALDLLERGIANQFVKPPSPVEMTVMIRRAHQTIELRRELHEARRNITGAARCGRLIGQSPKMLAVYDLIRRVADLDSGILVAGESGTGKELVAEAIHKLGSRADKPFVAISCGAIPETLIEAELFGHEKGAFTGATVARQGLLEKAGDGTLLLDEIGELTPMTQVKLLRVLQQREFTRVGGNRPIPLKARVICATHRDLAQMVAEETFRADLYFRINVMRIQVPLLRERPEDIPILANEFLRIHGAACRKQIFSIHPDAMRQLMTYDFPGNVRELENIIHRAVIVSTGSSIQCDDLPESLQPREYPSSGSDDTSGLSGSYEARLRRFKREITEDALTRYGGNKTAAAQSLRISRAYLHRLIQPESCHDENEVA